MKLSQRERRLLGIVALSLTALVVTRFVWFPMLRRREAIRVRLAEAELQQRVVQRNLLARSAVEESFAGLKEYLQEERSDEEELSSFLESLDEMFSRMSLRIGTMRALPPEAAPSFKKHTVQLEVTGSLSQVSRLITEISRSRLPIRTERLDVIASSTPGHVHATLWVSEVILLETHDDRSG